jgi:hypothetical protein
MTQSPNFQTLVPPNPGGERQLSTVLLRLAKALADENQHLESGDAADHSTFIIMKNQILKELMAMQTALPVSSLAHETVEQLRATRKLVDRNHQLLKLQVSALNDVTSFLTKAAISEQEDGTYNRNQQ